LRTTPLVRRSGDLLHGLALEMRAKLLPSVDQIGPDTPLRLSATVLAFPDGSIGVCFYPEAHAVRKQPPD
jgi:hypothetical protein